MDARYFSAVRAVVQKELRQVFRDKRMAAVLFVAPVLQLTLMGFAVDLDVDRVPTAATDFDKSAISRAFLQGVFADPTLIRTLETEAPDPWMQSGAVSVALVLDLGFEADLTHGRTASVQVLLDGTDPIRAQAAMAAIQGYGTRWTLARLQKQLEQQQSLQGRALSMPKVVIEPRVLYNPSLKSPVYMVPGVAAVVLLVVTTVVTAMSIARERELGTIEQLMVTPLRPSALLLGKVLPFAAIGFVAAGLVLGVGTHVFSVPVRGSLGVLALGTLLYLMSTLGTGIFISTLARNQQQAILGSFFFILPAILLSGFMSPIENMPQWLQWLSGVNPVRYYVQILRAVLLKGAQFTDLISPLTTLLGFGVLILTLGSIRFQKRLA